MPARWISYLTGFPVKQPFGKMKFPWHFSFKPTHSYLIKTKRFFNAHTNIMFHSFQVYSLSFHYVRHTWSSHEVLCVTWHHVTRPIFTHLILLCNVTTVWSRDKCNKKPNTIANRPVSLYFFQGFRFGLRKVKSPGICKKYRTALNTEYTIYQGLPKNKLKDKPDENNCR